MSDRKSDIREFIQACHQESWPFLTSLTVEDSGKLLYQDDGENWSIHTLISHLADSERGMLGQVKRALAGEMTVPDDFDLDRWNRGVAKRSADGTIPEFLDSILDAYQQCLELLDTLEESELDVQGRHASGDILTIEGFLRRIAKHRLRHAQDAMKVIG